MTNYRVAESVAAEVNHVLGDVHPLVKQLLKNRGVTTKGEADTFLAPSYEEGLHDPWLLHDCKAAVKRILTAIQNNQSITIFSDYDCDGIPGAVVLHDFLKTVGHTNFTNYIPHRHYEGFGFSSAAVAKIAEAETDLIVTIDCGTTDHEAAKVAKQLGIDVIITDHHEPKQNESGIDLPEVVAVVNPKVGSTYPFTGLCGAGVVYKLVLALLEQGNKDGVFTVTPGHEKWWLDMVGIATVADMVPLIDENRVLAHFGLRVLRQSRRPGVQQLLRKQGISARYLTEDDIGFTIGPRINAASRMDTPEDAFSLLTARDEGEAGAHVRHLEKLNNERKGLVAAMTKEAHKHIRGLSDIPPVLVFGNPDWRPSLVGLVANKLADEFNRPAFLWGRDGNGCFKGSCRSGGNISVVRLMDTITDHFLEHGGHHQSGGFTVRDSHIHSFHGALETAMAELGEAAGIEAVLEIDQSISLAAIDRPFLSAQQMMAPFGVANPKPVYEVVAAVPVDVTVFGKTKEHTKLVFENEGVVREAIAFFRLPEQFTKVPEVGEELTLLAHLEESFFMGRPQVRLRLIDIVK